MKIEMGESLFYSWLRHVKQCQIVQTNWKVSSQWELHHAEEIEDLLHTIEEYFKNQYRYKIFKKNSALSQIMRQAESDVLGIHIGENKISFYAIDVAFHESGLNYGTRMETVMKVLAKIIRTAFCFYGYFNAPAGEIVFASPKINRAILSDLLPCITYLNEFFCKKGFDFKFNIICNEAFDNDVLQPILLKSKNVADTSELFMRSYQMYNMFAKSSTKEKAGND